MIEGIVIQMGGKEFTVPALSLGQVRRLLPKIEKISTVNGLLNAEQMDCIVDVVHAAVIRNYPALTKEEVEDLIDLGNAAVIIKAVMGQSGLVRKDGAPGEA